jgi:hypothetical protein
MGAAEGSFFTKNNFKTKNHSILKCFYCRRLQTPEEDKSAIKTAATAGCTVSQGCEEALSCRRSSCNIIESRHKL